jgi:phosphatidylserine decarboxylase
MKIIKEGFPFIIVPLLAGLGFIVIPRALGLGIPALFYVCLTAGVILIIFALFCAFFFRDPKIIVSGGAGAGTAGNPAGAGLILSPCNGTVLEIEETETEKILRVFLSIFNVHLQRSPVTGTVRDVAHKNGKFYAAWNPLAQSENEQNIITIEGNAGVFVVRQIAGFLARRCVSWVRAGDKLGAGDKIGLIKFSSQVDLHMPKGVEITVKTGDKVRAGVTPVGAI